MKLYNLFYLFITSLFISTGLFAQDSLDGLSEDSQLNVKLNNESLFSLADTSVLNTIPDGNTVFIQQVGTNNVIATKVQSSQSQVVFSQLGDDNTALGVYRAGTVNASLSQTGTNNSFYEYVYGTPSQRVNSVNTQLGTNLTLEKFGSNSISNGLQVNMEGANKTILIYSFN